MKHFSRGFTLIELLVAMGIFMIIMTLAAGAYLIMIGANRETQAVANAVNSLSYSLEIMTRSIRTGSDYCNGSAVCPDSSSFSYEDQDGNDITYSLSGGAIYICVSGSFPCPAANNIPITDPSVNVTALKFHTTGAATTDTLQPYVTITVSGTASAGHGKSESFNVETSAVMRGINL